MIQYNNLHSLLPKMIKIAQNSKQIDKLSSVLLSGSTMIMEPVNNIDRGLCKNNLCGNLHAECNAISTYFGKKVTFNRAKQKWCLL